MIVSTDFALFDGADGVDGVDDFDWVGDDVTLGLDVLVMMLLIH